LWERPSNLRGVSIEIQGGVNIPGKFRGSMTKKDIPTVKEPVWKTGQ
jgi:hypothetical protein